MSRSRLPSVARFALPTLVCALVVLAAAPAMAAAATREINDNVDPAPPSAQITIVL